MRFSLGSRWISQYRPLLELQQLKQTAGDPFLLAESLSNRVGDEGDDGRSSCSPGSTRSRILGGEVSEFPPLSARALVLAPFLVLDFGAPNDRLPSDSPGILLGEAPGRNLWRSFARTATNIGASFLPNTISRPRCLLAFWLFRLISSRVDSVCRPLTGFMRKVTLEAMSDEMESNLDTCSACLIVSRSLLLRVPSARKSVSLTCQSPLSASSCSASSCFSKDDRRLRAIAGSSLSSASCPSSYVRSLQILSSVPTTESQSHGFGSPERYSGCSAGRFDVVRLGLGPESLAFLVLPNPWLLVRPLSIGSLACDREDEHALEQAGESCGRSNP